MHASNRPPGALQTPPCDASGRLQRLPGCVRLTAAFQAAIGGFPRPQPPPMLLLLLLSCCCSAAASAGHRRRPKRRARGRHRPSGRPIRRVRRRPRCGHGARCFCHPPSRPLSHSGRWSRLTWPAHRAHREGRNDARAAEGWVRRVEMDAAGRPGLGRWCWLRQGPGWQRAGAQEQQQAAFEGAESRVRKGGSPETRPRSPVKDKPTTRRPPAGPRIDDPGPLGCRDAFVGGGRLARR